MTARIDIKTPAGKSLEGFPQQFVSKATKIRGILDQTFIYLLDGAKLNPELTKGDTITIEIL